MNSVRLAIVVLSALTYGYAALTTWRMKTSASRAARALIAVYAFVVGVSNVTALNDPTNVRTLLMLAASIAAVAWVIGDVVVRRRANKSLLDRD